MSAPCFPIRRISFSAPEDERRRRAEELKGLCAAGQFEKVLEVVDGCLPKDAAGELDAEAEKSDFDAIVYRLYGLSEAEIAIVDESLS